MAFVEFGAQRIGAVAVPINAMLKAEEIQTLTADSGCRVLVTDRAVFDENVKERSRIPSVETWILVSDRSVPGFLSFREEIERASEDLPPVALADSDLAAIFYTAGTTGLPKGAMLSSGALMFSVRKYARIRAVMPFARRDLALLVMPLAHTGGHQALLLHMALGYPSYLIGRFDPRHTLEMIQELRVTQFSGIPAMYKMLLDAGAERYDLSSIRTWGGGGDRFTDELVRTFLRLSGKRSRFVRGYGLAETAGQIAQAQPGPSGDGCIGKPLRGVELELWDDELRPVPDGEVGEIVVRAPSVTKGYWNHSEMTEEAFRGGWFHTGDLARRDANGLYYMASRKKEMIKVGGYSVFPAEVEHELGAHPDVEGVAVVGVPHETKGERPVAAVVLRAGAETDADSLLAWARERIAAYKCPRQIFLVDGLPMSSGMKVKRDDVREMLLRRMPDAPRTGEAA
jgi:long-chain acyl-CoA synthetase